MGLCLPDLVIVMENADAEFATDDLARLQLNIARTADRLSAGSSQPWSLERDRETWRSAEEKFLPPAKKE